MARGCTLPYNTDLSLFIFTVIYLSNEVVLPFRFELSCRSSYEKSVFASRTFRHLSFTGSCAPERALLRLIFSRERFSNSVWSRESHASLQLTWEIIALIQVKQVANRRTHHSIISESYYQILACVEIAHICKQCARLREIYDFSPHTLELDLPVGLHETVKSHEVNSLKRNSPWSLSMHQNISTCTRSLNFWESDIIHKGDSSTLRVSRWRILLPMVLRRTLLLRLLCTLPLKLFSLRIRHLQSCGCIRGKPWNSLPRSDSRSVAIAIFRNTIKLSIPLKLCCRSQTW